MANNTSLAPIILFVYKRINHTKETVFALQNNELAQGSDLIIFSDGSKDITTDPGVHDVRQYIKSIEGFKNVTIVERDRNLGIAENVIQGVTRVMDKYGKAIVLEDDCITSPYFLNFMNDALDFYADRQKVWHISGWNYPIKHDDREETFFWRVMNCWGWATWADRWACFKKDTDKLIAEFSKTDIKRFNLDGTATFWQQVIGNKKGQFNTWAVYWYASIFQNDGLCLNPIQSYVRNIGLDGSGEHCGKGPNHVQELNPNKNVHFNASTIESEKHVKLIKTHFRKPLYQKLHFLWPWK